MTPPKHSKYTLAYCPECNQMTNHLKGVCQKSTRPEHSKYSSELDELLSVLTDDFRKWLEPQLVAYINKEKAQAELAGRINEVKRCFPDKAKSRQFFPKEWWPLFDRYVENRTKELEAQLSQDRSDSD